MYKCMCIGNYYNFCLINKDENTVYLHTYRYLNEIICPIRAIPIMIKIVSTSLQMKI